MSVMLLALLTTTCACQQAWPGSSSGSPRPVVIGPGWSKVACFAIDTPPWLGTSSSLQATPAFHFPGGTLRVVGVVHSAGMDTGISMTAQERGKPIGRWRITGGLMPQGQPETQGEEEPGFDWATAQPLKAGECRLEIGGGNTAERFVITVYAKS